MRVVEDFMMWSARNRVLFMFCCTALVLALWTYEFGWKLTLVFAMGMVMGVLVTCLYDSMVDLEEEESQIFTCEGGSLTLPAQRFYGSEDFYFPLAPEYMTQLYKAGLSLEEQLRQAIENEDYELAAKLRDKMSE